MELKASYHQQRLWFIDQFEAGNLYEGSPIYHNIPLVFWIEGKIDTALLEKSIKAVINRHEALRTKIITKDSQPFQIIELEAVFKLEHLDLINYQDNNKKSAILEFAINFTKQPFKLDVDFLIRGKLFSISSEEHLLAIGIHHMIIDRYSLKIIAHEIFLYYDSFQNGKAINLPKLSAHYADFSNWQHGLSDDVFEPILFYWKNKLKGKLQALQLPTDIPRAPIHIFHDERYQFKIEENSFNKIQKIASQYKTVNSQVLLAVFNILLYRYAGQEEILIGMTVENKNQEGLQHIVGPIANLLVLRNFLNEKSDFIAVLKDCSETVAEAIKYKDIPFEKLDTALKPPTDMSRTVFFDVLFQYDEELKKIIQSDNFEIKIIETNLGYGKYDLNLLLQEESNSISGLLVYNKDYYSKSTIERFITHFIQLLNNCLENPNLEISALNFLTEKEKKRLLYDFNGSKIEYPRSATLLKKFAEQLKKTPDYIALIGQSELADQSNRFSNQNTSSVSDYNIQLTYRELNEKSRRIGSHLRKQGGGCDTIIAIMVERSIEMIIGILGILKSGGAYLPIDANYPQERIDYLLKESRAKFLLTINELREYIRSTQALFPKNETCYCDATSLAYVIYTSGTTGRPKGAMIEHRNIISLLFNEKFQFDFCHSDVWTMFHSFCFDFSVWEMYGALLFGGKLVVISKRTAQDTVSFLKLLLDQSVTILNQTPSAFYRLMDEVLKKNQAHLKLKYIIFGGEALNPEQLKEWIYMYNGVRLINMYGITETTVHVTYKKITDAQYNMGISNIGKHLPTLETYVLDRNFNLVPIGVAGELFVGGDGVCRGYLNNPGLTSEKFIDTIPIVKRTRLYRSGDMVKLLENGDMIYLGRIDSQVKIRGFRIELGEIENQLATHLSVKNAIVVDRNDNNDNKYLCAYFVINSSDLFVSKPVQSSELRDFLTKKLPDYMVPSFFVKLDEIPLTDNGKVDRMALPEPQTDSGELHIEPGNEVQRGIAYILSEVLGIDYFKISVRSNIFELGVNSITLIKIANRISTAFNTNIELSMLFNKPTIEMIVKDMQKNYTFAGEKRPVLLNSGKAKKNLFFISGDGVVYGIKELAKLLEGHFNVYGIQAKGIMDTGPLPKTREEIYEEYFREIKSTQPEGPYWLSGQCFGSFISYELVRILEDKKNKVEKLILFDEASVMGKFFLDHMIINRIYYIYRRIRLTFQKIFRPGKKSSTSGKKPGLMEDLDARRIEVRENLRKLFGNKYWQFKRIIKTPVLTFKAFQGHYPNSHRWLPEVISKMSTKTVEVINTPGDHDSMFVEPHVQVLAKYILEKA